MSLLTRIQSLFSTTPPSQADAAGTGVASSSPSAVAAPAGDAAATTEAPPPVCTRFLPAGEVVVREGEPGHSMFVVLEGRVAVVREAEGGEKKEVARLAAGEFFGELALLTGTRRMASVVTVEDSVLLELSQSGVKEAGPDHGVEGQEVESAARERLLADALRSNPLIASLPPELKAQLGSAFVPCTVQAGETLLTRGKPGEALYILLRGRCEVFHTHEDGRQTHYPELGEGALFGEISLLRSRLATATVRTLTPCTLLRLDRDVFKASFMSQPDLRGALVRLGLERLKQTMQVMDVDPATLTPKPVR